MDQNSIEQALSGLSLGPIHYFSRLGSTNDEAASRVDTGAPDRSLILADEQVAGRGRLGRRWFTPPGAALALSLILRPGQGEQDRPEATRLYTALGALALADVLEGEGLTPEIKWPNDVLLSRRKTAGILVEAIWSGSQLGAVILGIGVNISPDSVPGADDSLFPATCVEAELGRPVDRLAFLRALLSQILMRRPGLSSPSFLEDWNRRLAFKGEWVRLAGSDDGIEAGQVVELDQRGGLIVRSADGKEYHLYNGEISLRPSESGMEREE